MRKFIPAMILATTLGFAEAPATTPAAKPATTPAAKSESIAVVTATEETKKSEEVAQNEKVQTPKAKK